MTRFVPLANCVLGASLFLGVTTVADEPPKKLTSEERKELESKREELNAAAESSGRARKYGEAVKACQEALAIARRLYDKVEYPDGHANLATSLHNLAFLLHAQGKPSDAEPLYRDALAMRKRLFRRDHWDVAQSLNSLGGVLETQAKFADAESLYRDALSMRKRLSMGDHPGVAISMNNLAFVLKVQGKFADAEPLFRDALAMRKRLFRGDHPAVAFSLNNLALLLHEEGKLIEAKPYYRDALEMRKRLYKGDHPDLALGFNNLAAVLNAEGNVVGAEALHRDALEMRQRLFEGRDHTDVAQSLNNLAMTVRAQGKIAEAESLYRSALDMRRRLIKGDHPDVATSLNNLAAIRHAQGELSDAESHYREALAMTKRLFKGDHPDVALILRNLAGLFHEQKKMADSELFFEHALDMYKRLNFGDHLDVANCLNNLAFLQQAQGKLAQAETLYRRALEMSKRLLKGDHGVVAGGTSNLGGVLHAQGKLADAALLFRDAIAMYRRLVRSYASQKTEGDALTLLTSLPGTQNGFLTVARKSNADPAAVYSEVWAWKSAVARVYEQRQLAARAARADGKAAKLLADLVDARRRRAELLLAPVVKDLNTRAMREDNLKKLDKKIAEFDRDLRPLLPTIARAEELALALPNELQKALPADCAVVDFLQSTFIEFDKSRPGSAGEKHTSRYSAFVVTKDKVAWLDLESSEKIERAVAEWREAIISNKEILASIPAKARELIWEKVRKELPANMKTLYISPDAALCRLPWAALPGDKPGTILLEDFAVATIPHTTFLLDKLWPQEDPLKNPPTGALVVGGVRYDAELKTPQPAASVANRGDPLVKPDASLNWPFLDGTAAEAARIAELATSQQYSTVVLGAENATGPAILAALPKAKFAHFATHGFFADPSFRSVFQLDPTDYEKSRRGERIGRAMNSPLVMTGLVFAGANNPKTPGRGIVTGEALIDLDLSGLELAVLSACETGLGDVAAGEGTFGLQRAFHLAGARNVVASLWKVPDQTTSALMGKFYHELWVNKKPPIEALRLAQLTIYRHPELIPDLAGERGRPDFTKAVALSEAPSANPKRSAPKLWAGFVLSGLGK